MKFTRHAYHRKKRLSSAWRRPKGLHNKQRLQKKGATRLVKDGYGSPAEERNKRKGLEIVQVYNVQQLSGLDPKEHGIVLGAVGRKKKLALLDAIEKGGFTLLTGKPSETKKMLEEEYAEERKTAEERRKEREERQKELEEKAKEAEKEAEAEKAEESKDEKSEKAPAKKAAKKAVKKSESDDTEEKSKEEQEKDKVLTKAR